MKTDVSSCCATNEPKKSTGDYSLAVSKVSGICGIGEKWAKKAMEENKIPVFSCEGPCLRGEIARLAANMVAKQNKSCARSCHGELFFVPHSSIAKWIKEADKVVIIDGCFLKCHGRVLSNLIDEEKIIHIDAYSIHKKYANVFLYEDIPETERKKLAQQVADKVSSKLAI